MSLTAKIKPMKYALYGLTLETPFPCPELQPATGDAEVVVKWGKIAGDSLDWRDEGVCYKAAPGKYLLSIAGVADFLVENGKTVTIEKTSQGDEDALRLFFYNEVMGALLMQRGCLLLKGCVMERAGKGIAFIGPTPSGKTMTAARLVEKGFRVVSDGFCCLSGNENPTVQPGYSRLMLWEKSLEKLGLPPGELKPVRRGMQRFYLPLGLSFCNEPVSLESAYVFAFLNRAELLIEEAEGAKKLFALLNHRYHPELTMPLGMMETVGRIAANLANTARVKFVRHNDTLVPFDDCIERMEQELEDEVR
jgi:hypothetical protein